MKLQLHPWAAGLGLSALPALAYTLPQAPNAETRQEDAVALLDPRAESTLWEMSEYLKSARAFTFRADATLDEAHPSGQWVEVSRTSEVALHRENGIRASVRGDLDRREFWCDLETAAMLDPVDNLYALVEVPESLDDALDHLLDQYGISAPLADLLYSDPFVVLTERVQLGTYVGRHTIDGTPCHHLAFQQERIDWQIWIDAGPVPVPRKVSIQYKDAPGAPRFRANLSEWNLAAHLPKTLFDFVVPRGAEPVDMAVPSER